MTASDDLSRAAAKLRAMANVQRSFHGAGAQRDVARNDALATLFAVLSNAVWHEETNHVPVLPAVTREAAAAAAVAINQEPS